MMKHTPNWFEVNKDGLAKIREGLPKSAIVQELVQNVWDTNAAFCHISLRRVPSSPFCILTVEDDDPNGFNDLAHAYTMFAESEKKGDAEKRGRFNLGEKLVLAMCVEASIHTTTGSVIFDPQGRTTRSGKLRDSGSLFIGKLRLTAEEVDEIRDAVFQLIPPANCVTTYNDIEVPTLTPVTRFEATLPTVISDSEGNLRPTRRKCAIEVYETQYTSFTGKALAGDAVEEAMIYEMGIPVVASGDRYHYNVLQKVPLGLDRSNVTPAFLRDVRQAVAEQMREAITEEEANQTWVRVAAANPDASQDLVRTVFEARFGKDAVVYDPSDPEANKRALDAGRRLVYGSQMNKDEWGNVRAVPGLALAAGKVFFKHRIDTDPNGRPWRQASNVTHGMLRVAQYARWLAENVLGVSIQIDFISEPTERFSACYGSRRLAFNVGKLGYAAFEVGLTATLLDLIIHELAHELASDHLTEAFYRACTMIGSKAAILAFTHPRVYEEAGLSR